ncbi:MAG TPA: Mut7-C RNAse domain-containing protein [Nitrosomonas sp.]|nr:Mut7-C RNAse domain-containing protein [Nitrosomonas sp.]HMW21100.1 Mut7-C RNAse domain-containing protein [Nitrosomonas sp.]HMY91162.1 Mut7-C RNAse domain-containing protein [Nitrosomonas sp.]HNA71472.1 Mut7-C RNAse domain-containing protein [Nitrosomonas sp.]HNB02343.1 Mut7-C RNAse domain-containing protein [Nitrosomonas sp.]
MDFTAYFRFYAELNDFLPPIQRQQVITYRFNGHPGIKDPIEAQGIPHPEVELILVNDQPVDFSYQLRDTDRVAVYPKFIQLNLSGLPRLRSELPNPVRFIVDVNLGKLAKLLRLLGFDSLYCNHFQDSVIVATAIAEQRIILTRDRRLLFAKKIEHGYWIRAVEAKKQTHEVLNHFELHTAIQPFSRCLTCNGLLAVMPKASIIEQLEPKTKQYYDTFYQCTLCQKIYWEGSHLDHMRHDFAALLSAQPPSQQH